MSELTIIEQTTDLTTLPTETLRERLVQAVGITAKTLSYLSGIWHELERRGEDLSDLRGGLMTYLPLIAAGRLDPEMVVRCAGQAMLLRAASEISLVEQRKLLERGAPIVVIDDETGSLAEVSKPLEKLNAAEVRKIFAGTHVRTPAEQAKLIARTNAGSKQTTARGVIVKIRLTQEEYRALRQRAANANKHVPTLARELILGEKNESPAYEPDDGALSKQDINDLRSVAGASLPKGAPLKKSSLFND